MATNDQPRNASASAEAYEVPSARQKRGMVPIRVTLGAGSPQQFGVPGDWFHVLTAPITDLKARFDGGKLTPVYEGVGMRVYYEQVELSSATGQTVEVLVGFGSVQDGRASANVNVSSTVGAGNTLNNGGDISCVHAAATQLLAADATRLYAIIGNPSTNTQTMRIGPATVDATHGIMLEPGTTLPISTTAAIYAYNPSGTTDETLNVAVVQQV